MDQAQRFVFSGPGPVEDAIRWGVEHRFTRVDFNADTPPNYPANAEPGMIKNDLAWMADNRERVLAEWSKRYDSKAAPKN